jgi:hypothetical protein
MTPKGNIGLLSATHGWSLAREIMEFRRWLVALGQK